MRSFAGVCLAAALVAARAAPEGYGAPSTAGGDRLSGPFAADGSRTGGPEPLRGPSAPDLRGPGYTGPAVGGPAPPGAAGLRGPGFTSPARGGGLGGRLNGGGVTAFSGPGMPYNFDWQVEATEYGNLYDHGEDSDGLVTQGQYRVLLPDGRTQVVTYSVEGDSGYQAEVTYEGEAQFPSRAESPVGLGPLEFRAGASYSGLPGGGLQSVSHRGSPFPSTEEPDEPSLGYGYN